MQFVNITTNTISYPNNDVKNENKIENKIKCYLFFNIDMDKMKSI